MLCKGVRAAARHVSREIVRITWRSFRPFKGRIDIEAVILMQQKGLPHG